MIAVGSHRCRVITQETDPTFSIWLKRKVALLLKSLSFRSIFWSSKSSSSRMYFLRWKPNFRSRLSGSSEWRRIDPPWKHYLSCWSNSPLEPKVTHVQFWNEEICKWFIAFTWFSHTLGILEYRSGAFCGALKGDLMALYFSRDDSLRRLQLSPDGRRILLVCHL